MTREPVHGAIIAPVVAFVCLLLPLPDWMFESFYSRDLYPWLQGGITGLSNTVPIALLDVFLLVFAGLVVYRVLRLPVAMRRQGVVRAGWELVRRFVRAVAVLVILFLVVWGFNYRRLSLESSFGEGKTERPSASALVTAFNDANALAARLRPTVMSDGRLGFDEVAAEMRAPMNQALTALGRVPLETPGVPKHSLFVQPFFVRAGVDGMINPLALETVVNRDLLPVERPFVVAHEWAHLAGHADEAEASAVGWLACMNGGPALAYSASLYLIMQTQAALPMDIRAKVVARLDRGVRADLEAIAQRLEAEDPTVQRAAARVYDEYLRANRVEGGTASYGRALELILSPPIIDALGSYR